KVQPGKAQPSRSELRRNKPEQIYEPHHDDQHGDKQEFFGMTLYVSGKQQNERQREMEDYEQNPDIPELAGKPPEVPWNLVWQVALPDYQQLRKRKVRP